MGLKKKGEQKLKRLNKIAALSLVLVVFMFLPGCIGQEEEPETITETRLETETRIETVTEETTEPEVMNPYVGSGMLDGDGIPLDFFTDIDIRKGFAYAMDYDTLIEDALVGDGKYVPSPIIEGLPYFNPDQTGYYLDLAKSEEHFKKAWNGAVWETGFRFTITYNIGNEVRRITSEILKRNVESLNEKFFIYVRAVEWPTFIRAFIDSRLPIFVLGWIADFPDPHNFAQPFMHSTGDFTAHQQYSNPTIDDLVERGVDETDPVERQKIYYELQKLYVEDLPSVALYQTISRYWMRDWVNGWWYASHLFGPTRWYDYWKSPGAKNPETMIWATYGDIESLDPAKAYDTASSNALNAIYETLIYYWHDPEKVVPKTLDSEELTHPSDRFIPVLAEEVPTVENGGISADGLTYRFKIKKGIKFSNGADLTPEDVEYSIERVMVSNPAGGPAWMFLEPLLDTFSTRDGEGNIVVAIEDIMNAVTVDGDYVVFHLAKPYAPFMHILTQCWASILDKDWAIANGAWDGNPDTYPDFNNPEVPPLQEVMMGTGPYTLEYWTHEVEYSVLRNDAYRGGPAKIKRAIVKIIPEWSTRKLMFLAGDADFCSVPPMYKQELYDIEGIRNIGDLAALTCTAFYFTFDINPL